MRGLLMRGWVLLAAALAACSPLAGEASAPQASAVTPARHATSGLEVLPLTVTTADGTRHAFMVEMAISDVEQQRGLMFRTTMGADEGMLFPKQPAQSRSFWMQNTVIPLDIIFIGGDRRVLNIAANTVPYSLDSIPSAGPVIAVLELNGGRAAQLGIKPGDRVEW